MARKVNQPVSARVWQSIPAASRERLRLDRPLAVQLVGGSFGIAAELGRESRRWLIAEDSGGGWIRLRLWDAPSGQWLRDTAVMAAQVGELLAEWSEEPVCV